MHYCLMAYRTRNVTFEARFLWFMAYRTRNATFKARLVWYMAYRTGNITFEARLFRHMAYRTGSETFEAHLLRFMPDIERGIFLLKRTCFALWLIERGIYFCTALVSLFSLNFRTKNIKFQGSALVLVYGL